MGTGQKVKGRYSFIYVWEDGEWKIAHHHSSVMPEGISVAEPITDKEVRGLFNLWNDALATLEPTKVADRYSKNAVLLPTVSDVPRTDYPGIVDYFTNFLKLKPQGEILSGDIIVGTNWAQDAGIYEFTMGASGAKVKGRYTYIYVFEDGEWKISQHHSSVMPEANKPEVITESEVRNLFQLWNSALATEDADAVAQRYAKDATLLPTVSDVPRTDYDLIKDYFVGFLKKKPQGEIKESYVTIGDNWCQDTGIYEFNMGASGDKVKARYSFVYVYEDGQWKIAHHHSSKMPEAPAGKQISEKEVRSLFYLWNDALATLDPDKVAQRYAKKGVLLPTVSDTPRSEYSTIKDYFVDFLKKEPQGKILDSYVTIGDNWCKDVGIYEFTMGATGDKVKARYSYVHVYEDGEWKISHHHSSVMPEGMLAAAAKLEELEKVAA